MSEYLEKLEKCRTCENDMALASNYKQSQITALTQRNTELEKELAQIKSFKRNAHASKQSRLFYLEEKHAELVEAVKDFVRAGQIMSTQCNIDTELIYSRSLTRVNSLIEKEV